MFLKLQSGVYSDAEAVSVALKQSVQGMCTCVLMLNSTDCSRNICLTIV